MKKQIVNEPVFVSTKEDVQKAESIYRQDQYLTFNCQSCKKPQQRKIVGFKVQGYQFYCTKCQRVLNNQKTCLEKYGVQNAGQVPAFQEKIQQTKLKRYGDKFYTNLEKGKKTIQERYGVDNCSQSQQIKDKKKETFKKHFGEDNVFKTEYFREKRLKTSLEKYGTEYPSQSDEVKQKQADTNYERWGCKSTMQNPEVRDKVSKKLKVALAKRTPEEWSRIRQKGSKRYLYKDIYLNSSWEVALMIYAEDHNIPIEHEPVQLQYEYDGKMHRYYPDFRYNGELLELKGPHFFNDKRVLINPFEKDLDELNAAKWKYMQSIGIKVWSTNEMKPILDYVESKYTKDYIKLFETNLPFPYPELYSTGDFDVIRFFHKSLYEASYKGKPSPIKAWSDKNIIQQAALNRLQYIGRCTPKDVLKGLTLAHLAPKVSIFKPKLAERLIKTYLNEHRTIVDPFSGFSGRMVGAENCKKIYTGRDINEKHVQESNWIINYKNYQNSTVTVEDILKKTSVETFDCLFTCPPYGGKEHWNENNDEVEKSCDEWIDICLQVYNCRDYLFVVDETEKYKDYVVEELEKKTLWPGKPELVIKISKE